MIEIRWHGRGGQGGFTAARLLGMAAALFGDKYALAFPAFGPERRGAPVLGFTRINDKKITDRSEVEQCDYVVVLDDTLMGPNIWQGLKVGGCLIINSPSTKALDIPAGISTITLDASTLAMEILGQAITNTAMLGALIAVSGLVSLHAAQAAITRSMSPGLAAKNVKIIELAYRMTVEKRS